MRIVVALGSYKGTLISLEATDIVARAVQQVLPSASVEKLVLADGGRGTIEAFNIHCGAAMESQRVRDPLGRMVSANLCFLEDGVAVIESSQAIGFSLLTPSELNPFRTSSHGVGALIKHAVQKGAQKVMVTMGDSATMDMGVGMLHALGVKFYSNSGELDSPGLHNLRQIVDFDDSGLDVLRNRVAFLGLVDTNDYLCGKMGQVQLYGRQKGLKSADVPVVEAAFFHFAALIEKRLGVDVTTVVRSSGSGGLAAALHAFLGADLLNTLEYLSRQMQLVPIIRDADITITGEGRLDNTTKQGKVPYFVAKTSSQRCVGIVGKYTRKGLDDMLDACDQFSIFTLNPEFAVRNPRDALWDVAVSISGLLA